MKESSVQKGNSYEKFVAEVYQVILDKQAQNGEIKPLSIERLKQIQTKSGTNPKVDIYWEFEIAGITHKTIIECKNYQKPVGVDDIREFAFKLQEIGNVIGILVSKSGFQDGAKKLAEYYGINLLTIRELIEDDWEGRIKEICIQMHISLPIRIKKITPKCNKEWGGKTRL